MLRGCLRRDIEKKTALIQAESPGVMLSFFFFFHSPLLFSSPLPSSTFTPPRPVESDNTLRIKNEKTRSLLLFTNVTEKHFGNYTCFASNRLGASNASMLLFRKLIQKYMQVHAHNAQFTLVRKTRAFTKYAHFHPTWLSISVCEFEQM